MPTIVFHEAHVDCAALERLLGRRGIEASAYYKDPGGQYRKGLQLHVQVPLSTALDSVGAAVDRLAAVGKE